MVQTDANVYTGHELANRHAQMKRKLAPEVCVPVDTSTEIRDDWFLDVLGIDEVRKRYRCGCTDRRHTRCATYPGSREQWQNQGHGSVTLVHHLKPRARALANPRMPD